MGDANWRPGQNRAKLRQFWRPFLGMAIGNTAVSQSWYSVSQSQPIHTACLKKNKNLGPRGTSCRPLPRLRHELTRKGVRMGEWLRSPIRGVLLDITGVLYESSAGQGTVIPGSVSAVNRLRESGMPFRLVTNETTTPTAVLLDKLRGFGYHLEERELFSPIPAAVKLLRQEQLVPHLLVHPRIEGELRVGEEGSPASCVVVGDAEDNFSYANLNAAFQALMAMQRPRLITLGYGRYYKHNDQLQLDVGAFAKALEFSCGVESEVVGKPSSVFFNQALADMGIQPEEAVMVGDDISSDVGGAQKCGMRGVLVRTGKFTPSLLPHPSITPDCVADNLAEAVEQILAAHGKK